MDIRTIRFASRVLWGRITGKSYPFLVQLNVTNRCNFKCTYCYGNYYARSTDEMPLDQIKALIDELQEAGMFRLNLVGGEPLLRRDIGDIIEYTREKGIDYAMTTNGSLVSKRLEVLRNLNILCFSVDGRRENNDRNRGAGTFDKAMTGLEMCKSAGIPVQLSAVLTKQTVHDIDFMVELAEEYSCLVGFATLINQRGTPREKESDLYPSNEEVRKAMLRIAELKKQGKPILFSAKTYEYASCWTDYKQDIFLGETPDFQAIRCFAGKYFCLVDYNGDVYPCPQLVGIWKPGNVTRDGLRAALEKAANHKCKACCVPCSNDFSLFFGLNVGVLLDHLQNYGRN